MHKNKKVISLQNYFYVDNILFFLFGIRIFYAQSFSIYFVPHLTLFGQICAMLSTPWNIWFRNLPFWAIMKYMPNLRKHWDIPSFTSEMYLIFPLARHSQNTLQGENILTCCWKYQQKSSSNWQCMQRFFIYKSLKPNASRNSLNLQPHILWNTCNCLLINCFLGNIFICYF